MYILYSQQYSVGGFHVTLQTETTTFALVCIQRIMQ